MVTYPQVNADGSLSIRSRVHVAAEDLELRVTTSGGPGGQHANRSLTRVVVTFDVVASTSLRESDRVRVLAALGPVVRASAGRFRSQRQNRQAALGALAEKLAAALTPVTPRRATKPTKGSTQRRVDEKKARGRLKVQRRRPSDD